MRLNSQVSFCTAGLHTSLIVRTDGSWTAAVVTRFAIHACRGCVGLQYFTHINVSASRAIPLIMSCLSPDCTVRARLPTHTGDLQTRGRLLILVPAAARFVLRVASSRSRPSMSPRSAASSGRSASNVRGYGAEKSRGCSVRSSDRPRLGSSTSGSRSAVQRLLRPSFGFSVLGITLAIGVAGIQAASVHLGL